MEPRAYLNFLFERLPAAQTPDAIDALLPQALKPEDIKPSAQAGSSPDAYATAVGAAVDNLDRWLRRWAIGSLALVSLAVLTWGVLLLER